MEATLTLRADLKDLRPFKMMAKHLGIPAAYIRKEKTTLQKYRELARETQRAAKKAGLTQQDIVVAIKEVRKRRKECV